MQIRNALPADTESLAEVDALAWPEGLRTGRAGFETRLATYPEGQWVAVIGGKLVGWVCCQRIAAADLERLPLTYAVLTDEGTFRRTHRPDGEILQLVGVAALPAYAGLRLGRILVDHAVAVARTCPDLRRIVGITRPAGYRRYATMPIERYLDPRREEGGPPDPVVSFHLRAGAKLVSIHPDFRPEDRDARGYGVLIEYPLQAGHDAAQD